MEHSRLLKFLVPETLYKMAEPVKIKFDYQNPENVESEVPGAQKLREAQIENETGEILTDDSNGATTNEANGATANETNGATNENNENGEPCPEVVTRHKGVFSGKRNGIHGEPVLLDKADDKKSKIPISRFKQTVERVKNERRVREKKDHESHIPVRRSSISKPVKENKHPSTSVKKEITITKTLIRNDSAEPVVTKTITTKETAGTNTTKVEETTVIQKELETMEPEDEFDKIYAEIVSDAPTEITIDDSLLNPKVDDLEKLESKFEEIIHDYDEHKVEPIDVEVVRRSKLPLLKRKSQQEIELSSQAERTSKIIAARDKLRLRYSLNTDENFEDALDKELRKAQANNSDTNENKDDNAKKVTPNVDTKTESETKHEIISSPNAKTETVRHFTTTISTSSSNEQEQNASSSVIQSTTVKETSNTEITEKNETKKHVISEENIVKGSIKIGIPVFDSFIQEYSETSETAKTTEVKRVLSYTSKTEELSITNNISESQIETNVPETSENSNIAVNDSNTEVKSSESNFSRQVSNNKDIKLEVTKEKVDSINTSRDQRETADIQKSTRVTETDIDERVQIRGKVEKLISKIDSREVIETEGNQRESINELRKKKSVLSKIAMFEKKPEEPAQSRIPKKETRPPKLITKDWQKVEHVHVHTPLIVDEVFKSFTSDISLNDNGNKAEIPVKNDFNEFTIVRAESVTVENSDTVHYAAENKVQIEHKTVEDKPTELIATQTKIDSEYITQKVETATISDALNKDSSDNLTPQINEDKIEFRGIKNKAAFPSKLRMPKDLSNADIASPKTRPDNFDFKDNRNKALSPSRLSMTKELQSPITIPGFRPVSELLRSYESKRDTSRNFTKRSVSKIEQNITVETPTKNLETDIFADKNLTKRSISQITHKSITIDTPAKGTAIAEIVTENQAISTQISHTDTYNSEVYDDFVVEGYKSLDDVFSKDTDQIKLRLRQEDDFKRAKSLAELDLGDAVKGKVNNLISRMTSVDRMEVERREAINKKEMPRKRSVSEKIALFEGKLTPTKSETHPLRVFKSEMPPEQRIFRTIQNIEPSRTIKTEENITEPSRTDENANKTVNEAEQRNQKKKEDLMQAVLKYGRVQDVPKLTLSDGNSMPVMALGTALLDNNLIFNIVTAAIDLGYRAIDTAYVYGNENEVGRAIKAKIDDGTVKREDLFITNKLWSTYHRTDLVEGACRASLNALGLEYFDLYLIHNPMSFKEGGDALPKIATVLQYSEHDYLDAWYGMEKLIPKGMVRSIGVSNFNSIQLQRILDKGKVKPVVNQVECHPYLTQQRLDQFCTERNITLSCFGVLGSKGTPMQYKNGQAAAIDDPLVKVMAAGLGVSPAELLISYQLYQHHAVVVKASSAHHLYDNLLAPKLQLNSTQVDALHVLNKNRRMFSFPGMGDTHRNYPFNVAF